MMTFVPGTSPNLSAVPFAVEGDKQAVAAAKQIVKKLGAEVFEIKKQAKVLYHALGSFSSPLVVATLVTAERVGQAAGLTLSQTRKIIAPILQQTLQNYLQRGPAAAFSGPIKRGDVETMRRHLRELKQVPNRTGRISRPGAIGSERSTRKKQKKSSRTADRLKLASGNTGRVPTLQRQTSGGLRFLLFVSCRDCRSVSKFLEAFDAAVAQRKHMRPVTGKPASAGLDSPGVVAQDNNFLILSHEICGCKIHLFLSFVRA